MKYEEIVSRNDLADFLGLPRQFLTFVLYVVRVENCYKSFEIPKKDGRKRTIHSPNESLSAIQIELSRALSDRLTQKRRERNIRPNISHAFEKEKSIITNAKVHRDKRFVLNVDLKDFFDSFNFGRVRGFFSKNIDFCLPENISTIVAQLACYKGVLPQGAPSSPVITNLICQVLDYRLLKIVKKYRADYTRYADDLTFSSNCKNFQNNIVSFINELNNEIVRAGFQINKGKTRLQIKDSRQEVTGITVNKKLNTRLEYRRKTRAMAYSLYVNNRFQIDGVPGTIKQLEGRFAFIDQLDRGGMTYREKIQEGKKNKGMSYSAREREYQKFLFYRYFYNHNKPLILTEGKTDAVHLRAALKNMYKEYPELIRRKDDGSFEYLVTILRRTKRLEYFFGLGHGADSNLNLYQYCIGGHGKPNYWEYFKKKCSTFPDNPVMFLYDNELINKKPLRSFTKAANFSDEKIDELKKRLQCKVIENGNLHLLTIPLIDKMEECEIEDLYDEEVLAMECQGRAFSKEDSPDKNFYFGKNKFSKLIGNNYKEINFKNFKPLFDAIEEVLNSYSRSTV